MDNKENVCHPMANECFYGNNPSINQNSSADSKRNSNADIYNGNQKEIDSSGNILNNKINNVMADEKNLNEINRNVTQEMEESKYNSDLQNGNVSNGTTRPGSVSQREPPPTNLRRSHMAKSNPHLNRNTSYVDVHPLSSSLLMDVTRNSQAPRGLSIPRNSLTGINSQSTNHLNDDALQRITRQFTPSQIPIVGYEVMEERARFTIYKLRIDDPRTGLSWMVFRRYTDFVRLYQKLKIEHRNLVLPLPEKRVFRNNFDPSFLEERTRGLQLFVNAAVKKLALDRNVREFFCLDEPPDVGDAEPEAQALFGALEDTVGGLKNQLKQQEETIKYLRQKVYYLEEKMKDCSVCNPLRNYNPSSRGPQTNHSPMSSSSSNGS